MYNSTVPVLSHFMSSLQAILKKAEAHCAAKKIDHEALLKARLFPDMFIFAKQVQLVTDFAKGPASRLAGVAIPSYADDEKTFDELQARLQKTIDYLATLKPEQFADAATRTVTVKVGGNDKSFPGAEYFASIALPNFFFHLTTAYNILRHNGIELGKSDYMGQGGR
jgi:hypothetical protein